MRSGIGSRLISTARPLAFPSFTERLM
jgi:hypothetical protein